MKCYETGPARTNYRVKGTATAPELTSLVSLTVRLGKGEHARTTLKNALQEKFDPTSIDDTHQTVFYRHQIGGTTYAQVSKEFCQVAKSPAKSIVRLQIAISPSLAIREEHWYPIIRYCLYCFSQMDSPVVVFGSPVSTQYMDLFMLRDTSSRWQEQGASQQWLINKMMSIQIGLWLDKPICLTPRTISWPSFTYSGLNYEPYIAQAIYESLSEHRLETIHQLTDRLQKQYSLETHYRSIENYIYELRFRHGLLPWVEVNELNVGANDIRLWLNFNRQFKQNPIRERVLRGI